MTLKLAQFCDDPKKISTKFSYPKQIFIFLKTPKNIEIQNFEPKKMGLAYVCVKISEYPPWDGRVVCKIVFSITFNARFWCSKEPSHREDSFEHQKCLSENIIVDLCIISKLTSKLNIKKRDRVGPPAKCHLNGVLLADDIGTTLCAGWVYLLGPLDVWTNLIFFRSLRYLCYF